MRNRIFLDVILLVLLVFLCACDRETVGSDSVTLPCANSTSETEPASETDPLVSVSPASDFLYEEDGDGITILEYKGEDKNVVIPAMIEGKPVTAIGKDKTVFFDEVSVVMPDTVTVIHDRAFSFNWHLRSVTLSQNLTKIGCLAFNECYLLRSVMLPESLSEIGSRAFRNCLSLSAVSLPSTLVQLGDGTFQGCTALSFVTLPKTLTEIGEETFSGCSALREISIPATVSEIKPTAFNGSGLETIELSAGLEMIGWHAFAYTPLREVVLPETVKEIDAFAFSSCDFLETISLNQGLKIIGYGAFSGNPSLKQITIPSSVEGISETVFGGCQSLEKVIFEGNAPASYLDPNKDPSFPTTTGNYTIYYRKGASGFSYPVWNGYRTDILDVDDTSPLKANSIRREGDYEYFLSDNDTVLIFRYHGTEFHVVIPDFLGGKPVTEIGTKAFMNRENLRSVKFPDSVTTIGASAFEQCPLLAVVELPRELVSIGSRAFCKDESLTEVVLPKNLIEIGEAAFASCESLKSVIMGDELVSIGDMTFSDTKVIELILPASVRNVTDYAFYRCNELKALKFDGDAPVPFRNPDPNKMFQPVRYTVYYHKNAKGFDATEWQMFATAIW